MKKSYLFLIISIIILCRWVFLHQSVRSFPDEYYYNDSLFALDKLKTLNIKGFFFQLFNSSRPGYNIISLIPAFIQAILFLVTHIDPRTSISLLIPQFFNLIPAFFILFFIYKIACLLFKDNLVRIATMVCYGLCVNNSIYTTNLFPYDYSLAIIIWLMYGYFRMKLHNENLSNRSLFVYGLLASFSFTIYPGYYLVIPFFILFTFLLYKRTNWRIGIQKCLILCAGIISIIVFMQIISFIGGTNYILGAKQLSKTIVQGDFNEGFSFIIKYMFAVENMYGIIWILGICVFIMTTIISSKPDITFKKNALSLFTFYIFTVFIYYGFNSYVLHKMVFYGRLVHLFIPAMILATFALVDICKTQVRRIISISFLVGAIINVSAFYAKASNVDYPLYIINKYKIDTKKSEKLYMFKWYFPYVSLDDNVTNINSYTILNFGYFKTPDFDKKFALDHRDTLVYALHFQNLKAFQFEGLSMQVRDDIDKHPLYIGVFK